ncbi:hypothetical protein HY494_02975 [Candidatus Woesearchaeota archaeon]|nr:hypothetical protein [Candidatus Woesearchaeota archaeon]
MKSVKPSKVKGKNGSILKATELLREVINLIAVYKKEEQQDVTTRIDPETADELIKKLEQLAKAL